MKKLIILIAATAVFACITSPSRSGKDSTNKIVGTWEVIEDNPIVISYEYDGGKSSSTRAGYFSEITFYFQAL